MSAKKLIASTLACALAFSMMVPAFAADGDVTAENGVYAGKTEITGDITTPTITVNVPTTGGVMVNPYQMTYTGSDSEEHTEQIFSAVQYITNKSNVGISIDASVKGVLPEGGASQVVLAATEPTDWSKTTTKSAFIYLEVKPATKNDGSADPDWAAKFDKTAADQVVVALGKDTKKVGICKLDAPTSADAPNYAAFKLDGAAAPTPSVPWASTDKVNVTITFTFNPVMNTVTPPSP